MDCNEDRNEDQTIKDRYIVYFNTHRYHDCSDTPRSAHRIIKAVDAEEARNVLCDVRETIGMAGSRYIGMIHHAERA